LKNEALQAVYPPKGWQYSDVRPIQVAALAFPAFYDDQPRFNGVAILALCVEGIRGSCQYVFGGFKKS